ncbi:MAG: hypothetical protein ACI81R_001294 [Bradymonadia bacterium]|jgi:hypothetical protein
MTHSNTMLSDGSNPEGVDPVPALQWRSKANFTDVVVHGPAFSAGTTKVRCFLTYAGISFRHDQHMPKGFKPNTSYKKVPIIDVAGRQVNDSEIILKNLVPALGLEFNHAWERRIVLELDTTFKLHCESKDWAMLAVATMGAPSFLKFIIGPAIKRMERGQARRNIALLGLGHAESDEVVIAKDFKAAMTGRFFAGDAPGHVDLSLYGLMAGYLYAECPIAARMVAGADLGAWVESMDTVVPLAGLFRR